MRCAAGSSRAVSSSPSATRSSSTAAERGDGLAIDEILPRRSKLARRAPGGGHGERIVVANVDQVVVVFALVKPTPHPRMLDRFLVIAEANELAARIVVNKVDLASEAEAEPLFADYVRAGYPVHLTSTKDGGRGLEALHDALRGLTSVLTGPSGRREVVAHERAVSGAPTPCRRDQRIGEQGTAHDGRGVALSAAGRRIRRRHARSARDRHVGSRSGAARRVLSGVPSAHAVVSLRGLHAHRRAGMCGARRDESAAT